jgi:hypothetical protein
MLTNPHNDPRVRAVRVLQGFEIGDGLYLLGSLERGVTVYGQQVRAHNLTWALSELEDASRPTQKIAVVGGGIAGLTATACLLGLFRNSHVTLFEKSSDLCSLQQGCDTRWLHPRIYHWPARGSRAPSASLPVLNWHEGRASDVADQILRRFSSYTEKVAAAARLQVLLGVVHLRIWADSREIEWVGREGLREGEFFRAGPSSGTTQHFDKIVLAMGFGAENFHADYPTPRYWRSEELAQPRLDGTVQSYVVSGYGDGAIVDLCRLTIERFRQDRILYDLFLKDLEKTEEELRPIAENPMTRDVFSALKAIESRLLKDALKRLGARIRKDTKVTLHLGGPPGKRNTALPNAFDSTTAFSNRLLLYLLYRCGAFVPRFEKLEDVVRDHSGPAQNVICRWGPKTLEHLKAAFVDPSQVNRALERLYADQAQRVRLEWEAGAFPDHAE